MCMPLCLTWANKSNPLPLEVKNAIIYGYIYRRPAKITSAMREYYNMEIELKYRIPDEGIADRIWDNELFAGMEEEGSREELDLHARYFDTDSLDLTENQIAYRIRKEGDHYNATIKWQGISEDGLHRREELSCHVPDENADLELFCESDIGDELKGLTEGKELEMIMETRINRRRYRIDTGEAILEVSVDKGCVQAEGDEEPVLEVEIELFTGETDELLRIGRKMQKQYDLIPEDMTKYAKGIEMIRRGGEK